jgi:sarcosine oxidase subunit alpha
MLANDRPILVGFKPLIPTEPISAGAHFLRPGAENKLRSDEGYMTSAAWSPVLRSYIGLGLIVRGTQRMGEQVRAFDPVRSRDTLVEICSPIFYDPQGARLRD